MQALHKLWTIARGTQSPEKTFSLALDNLHNMRKECVCARTCVQGNRTKVSLRRITPAREYEKLVC